MQKIDIVAECFSFVNINEAATGHCSFLHPFEWVDCDQQGQVVTDIYKIISNPRKTARTESTEQWHVISDKKYWCHF